VISRREAALGTIMPYARGIICYLLGQNISRY
jgi:hypothetical protein